MKQYKRAITYGTFDLFHVGHLELLKRIKALAEEVYVGVSTDEFNNEKGKRCIIPFEDRTSIIESIKYVDKSFPEFSWDQKTKDIGNFGIDLFVMGNDWLGKFDYLKDYCEVKYLDRTATISSSQIKNQIGESNMELKEQLIQVLSQTLPRHNL